MTEKINCYDPDQCLNIDCSECQKEPDKYDILIKQRNEMIVKMSMMLKNIGKKSNE